MTPSAPLATSDFFDWLIRNDLRVDGRPFDWDAHRYLWPLYQDDAGEIVLLKGAQVGATVWLLLRLLWWVCEHSVKAGLYFPTKEGVEKLSKDRLAKLIEDNPAIRARLTSPGTLSLKQFGPSSLYLQHIGGTASKDSTPLDVIAFDEVRLVEGRDVSQAEERVSHSVHQVKYFASTAGIPNADVHARFLRTDQHHFHTRCGCPDGVVLSEVFPDCIAVRPTGECFYRCPRCGWRIRDPQNGRFVPHSPGSLVRGYHIHQLLSRYVSPRQVWQAFQETENKQEFYNAKLGVPYVDPKNVGLTADELDACLAPEITWGRPTFRDGLPDGRLCMGVDQMAGFNYVVVLQQTGTHRRLVRLEVIEEDDPFARCHELMQQDRIDVCVVDGMPNFNDAANFARAFPRRVFLAWWTPFAKDMVQWSDRRKQAAPTRRATAMTKVPWWVVLNKYMAIEYTLRQFQSRRIAVPHSEGYEQVIRGRQGLMAPMNLYEHFRDHLTSVIRQRRERTAINDEQKRIHTGDYLYDWVYTRGDAHFLDAATYALFAAERLAKRMAFVLT
jgi:hypothetical protein